MRGGLGLGGLGLGGLGLGGGGLGGGGLGAHAGNEQQRQAAGHEERPQRADGEAVPEKRHEYSCRNGWPIMAEASDRHKAISPSPRGDQFPGFCGAWLAAG